LYLARIIQGLATGLITGAVAATLIDLQPPDRPGAGALVNAVTPTFGLAAGALVAGTLVQYAAAPRQLVYIIMLAGFVLLLAALAIVPEPVTSRNRPQIRVRLTVERTVRAAFASAVPALVATWALGGLYLSLGPSLAYELSGSGNRLVGAMVVALLAGAGGAASLAIRSWAPRKTMLTGCAVLACGTAVTAAGITGNSFAVYCAGTVIAGTGFGSSFSGCLPDARGPGISRWARRPRLRHLHGGISGLLGPGRDRGPADRTPRPAPDRDRLRRGARRAGPGLTARHREGHVACQHGHSPAMTTLMTPVTAAATLLLLGVRRRPRWSSDTRTSQRGSAGTLQTG
jgi:MFS family permease